MATRNPNALIDAEGVKEIIDTQLTDSAINRFINMAYQMSIPLSGKLGGCGGSDALGEIQGLLAAHLISMTREQQAERESIAGEASVTYRGKSGLRLEATLFGQAALDMDCSGHLARLGKKRGSIRVWDSESINYDYDEDV